MKTILKNKSSQHLTSTGEPPPMTTVPPKPPKVNRIYYVWRKGRDYFKLFCSRVEEYIIEAYRSPTVKSSAIMALGLCFTFVGYEYSRAASITLLAAEETGLGSEALPLTVAVGFPSSALVLYLYTKSIKKFGAKMTLRLSNCACIAIFLLVFLFSRQLKGIPGKALVICFYAFREIYVSLLSSQQWAFISTTLDRTTSSYLVSFSGIVSIASAVGGCTVVQLVNVGGVRGLLLTTLIAVILGLICAEVAHSIADREEHSFIDPKEKEENPTTQTTAATISSHDTSSTHKTATTRSSNTTHSSTTKPKTGFWSDSWNLISSNAILQLLFYEAITHQFCSNMLNLMFHNGLRQSPEINEMKAKIVGRFFATVNVSASILQCFFFPLILSPSNLPVVMRYLPFVVFLSVLIGVIYPSTISVMLGFGTIKILEYSCMHTASEMIYMPLGRELRYVGKELIKFFGQKLGKSVAALSLSIIINRLQLSLVMQSLIGAGLTIVWGYTIFQLSDYLVERDRQAGHVKFSPDVYDGSEIAPSRRMRTKSEELRLSTSRSMPLFELPHDEEEEALFFKPVQTTEDQQPEDFFYGSFNDNSSDEGDVIRQAIVAAEGSLHAEDVNVHKVEDENTLFETGDSINVESTLRRRRTGYLGDYRSTEEVQQKPVTVQEKDKILAESLDDTYLSILFRALKATPIISMFIPNKYYDEKY